EGRSYEELALRQATTVSAVKSLLHRARATLAHQASLPAFVTPLVARLARVRPGQIAMGMIAEHATGAAAIATVALAGTSALGSLHAPGPPAAPTAAQSPAAAKEPRGGCSTQAMEYSHCDPAPTLSTGASPHHAAPSSPHREGRGEY